MKHNDKIDFENGSENLVNRIDILLDIRKEKRQKLCDEIGISLQAITNWKKQSSIPSGDTLIKVADYFKVDPRWLLTGKIDLPEDDDSKPSAVFNRIYNLLLKTTNTPDPDYHQVSDSQMENMWKSVEKIVSKYDLFNWQYDRIMPSYKQILELAEHFERPFTYIANGISEVPEYLNPCKVSESDYNEIKRFKQYKEFIFFFHCLSDSAQKVVENLVHYLFHKERETK